MRDMGHTPTSDERQVLDLFSFLTREATMLERLDCPFWDTPTLRDGAGGSFLYGWPYLERGEQWPVCAHGVEMEMGMQVDGRDARHASAIPGLYVTYQCAAPVRARFEAIRAGRPCLPVVRYYPDPDRAARAPIPSPSDDIPESEFGTLLIANGTLHMLPRMCVLELIAPEQWHALPELPLQAPWGQVVKAVTCDENGYYPGYDDHFGGWHITNWDRQMLPPPCPDCDQMPQLVVQLEWGDGNRSLWACPEHPERAHYEKFHK